MMPEITVNRSHWDGLTLMHVHRYLELLEAELEECVREADDRWLTWRWEQAYSEGDVRRLARSTTDALPGICTATLPGEWVEEYSALARYVAQRECVELSALLAGGKVA